MFKLKYKEQEIGLDKDCRIDLGSVKTNASTSYGWSANSNEMDEIKTYGIMTKLDFESEMNPDCGAIADTEKDNKYTVVEKENFISINDGLIVFEIKKAEHPSHKNITGVTMGKIYTAETFIQTILKSMPYNHGYFCVGEHCFYYQDGELEYDIPEHIKNEAVHNVTGLKSFDCCDYNITLLASEDKVKKPAEDFMNVINEMFCELQDIRLKYETKIGMNILSITVRKYGDMSFSTDCRNGIFGLDITV